jgi:hypothetical protein
LGGVADGVLETVKQAFFGLASGTSNALGGFVQGFAGIGQAFADGKIDQGFARLIGDVGVLVRNEVDVVGTAIVNVLLNFYVGVWGGVAFGHAPTQVERDFASGIFGDKVNLTFVRVVDFSYNGRGITTANVVYIPNGDLTNWNTRRVFAHELTHVFQNQTTTDSGAFTAAQENLAHDFFGSPDPYALQLSLSTNWQDLGSEAQAKLVENYELYRDGNFDLSGDLLRAYNRILDQVEFFGRSLRGGY